MYNKVETVFSDALRLLTCIPFLSPPRQMLASLAEIHPQCPPLRKTKANPCDERSSGLTDRQDGIGVHAGASCITPGTTASFPRCQNPPFTLRRFDRKHGRAEELVLVCLSSEFRSPSEHYAYLCPNATDGFH